MYVRFEVRRTGEGLFQVIDWGDYRANGLSRKERHELGLLRHWLHTHTWAPEVGAYRSPCARTWWAPDAREHIRVSWRVCRLMNRAGVALRPIHARQLPGRTVYRDSIQVVIHPSRRQLEKLIGPDPRSGRAEAVRGWSGDRTTIRRWRT